MATPRTRPSSVIGYFLRKRTLVVHTKKMLRILEQVPAAVALPLGAPAQIRGGDQGKVSVTPMMMLLVAFIFLGLAGDSAAGYELRTNKNKLSAASYRIAPPSAVTPSKTTSGTRGNKVHDVRKLTPEETQNLIPIVDAKEEELKRSDKVRFANDLPPKGQHAASILQESSSIDASGGVVSFAKDIDMNAWKKASAKPAYEYNPAGAASRNVSTAGYPADCTINAKDFHNWHYIEHDVLCPSVCPYQTPMAGGPTCPKVCLLDVGCKNYSSLYTFPTTNHEGQKVCEIPCGHDKEDRVPACKTCEKEGKCKECVSTFLGQFELSEDGKECIKTTGQFWIIVKISIVVAFVLGFILLIWIGIIRVEDNTRGLLRAIDHKQMAGAIHGALPAPPREPGTLEYARYPCPGTNVHTEDIAGFDYKCYFDTTSMLFFMSLLFAGMNYWAWQYHDNEVDGKTCRKAVVVSMWRVMVTQWHNDDTRAAHQAYEERMRWVVLIQYILTCALGVWSAARTQRISSRIRSSQTSVSTYCVVLTNVPEDVTEPQEVLDALTTKLPTKGHDGVEAYDCVAKKEDLVGVSIAYDFEENADLVQEACEFVIQANDDVYAEANEVLDDHSADVGDDAGCCAKACSIFISILDPLLLLCTPAGGLVNKRDTLARAAEVEQEITPVLEEVKCEGTAYLVCNSPAAAGAVIRRTKQNPLILRDQKVNCGVMAYPPDEIVWEAFTKTNLETAIIIGWVLMWVVFIVYIAMYAALAYDFMTGLMVAGAESDYIAETILSISIAVGTVLICLIVEAVVPNWCDKYKHEKFQRMYNYGYFFCALVLATDLLIVLSMSQAQQMNETAEGKGRVITVALAQQFYEMIMPGYLIIPYLAESAFDTLMPRYVGAIIVGARPDMSHWLAEKALEGPEMNPVWRYVDMANFFTATMVMLGMASIYNYYIFLAIAFAIALIYCIDYLRILRGQTCCNAETSLVTLNFWFYWSFPTAVIGFMAAIWWVKTLYIREPWLHDLLHRALLGVLVFRRAHFEARAARDDGRAQSAERQLRELLPEHREHGPGGKLQRTARLADRARHLQGLLQQQPHFCAPTALPGQNRAVASRRARGRHHPALRGGQGVLAKLRLRRERGAG
ncbi:unnamed protein product [Amoebophrya sp. A120]|nr:unnamed protein product [Amoebophrya sp. A120]|eukprot:GSA120T00001657001.1